MLPHGTRIYNALLNMLKREYKRYQYDEIMTPMIYKHDLWNTSGHLQNYREDMYMVAEGVLLWLCDYYDRQFSVRYTVVDRRMSFSVLSCGG